MDVESIQMALVYGLAGYPPLAVILKTALQVRWAGQLYNRYGAAYPYGFFRCRMGWARYRVFSRRRRRSVHPALLDDLKAAQRRSLIWDLGLGAVWAATLALLLALQRAGL